MTGMKRFGLIGTALIALLVASTGVASAQTTPPPAAMAGITFDAAKALDAPSFELKAAASALSTSQAQNRAQGIGFGVIGGISRNKLSGDDESESGTGTFLGVWVGGNKGGRIGFTGEFLFLIRKVSDGDDELKYNALSIPAVFHVNFGRGGPEDAMGYAIVGPVFTINLKQQLNGIDVSEDFNGADFGLMLGGGVEILRLAVEIRYVIGLRNIDRHGEINNIKSREFQVAVKFRFSGA